MGRNLVLLVAAALLTAACTRSDPPAPAPVAVTEVRTPAPETVAPAAAPAAEQEKPVAEQDITGDGRAERIFFKSEKGQVRILDTEGQVLFEFLIPEFHRLGSDVAVLPLSDRPPLVLISWPWCLRSYPNNLFVWFDPAAGKLVADRDPNDIYTMRCGVYEHKGDGLFDVRFRNEELYYYSVVRWHDQRLTLESRRTELLYAEVGRLHEILGFLTEHDIINPEGLFDPPELYQQFKARAEKDWSFRPAENVTANSLTLPAVLDGKTVATLTVDYRIEGRFRSNILITGLRWSP